MIPSAYMHDTAPADAGQAMFYTLDADSAAWMALILILAMVLAFLVMCCDTDGHLSQ